MNIKEKIHSTLSYVDECYDREKYYALLGFLYYMTSSRLYKRYNAGLGITIYKRYATIEVIGWSGYYIIYNSNKDRKRISYKLHGISIGTLDSAYYRIRKICYDRISSINISNKEKAIELDSIIQSVDEAISRHYLRVIKGLHT